MTNDYRFTRQIEHKNYASKSDFWYIFGRLNVKQLEILIRNNRILQEKTIIIIYGNNSQKLCGK